MGAKAEPNQGEDFAPMLLRVHASRPPDRVYFAAILTSPSGGHICLRSMVALSFATLLSGYKLNRISWLEKPSKSDWPLVA
jgi:hypothetical protein